MAIRPADTYVNTTPADANFPYGSSKNETSPGLLNGTPLEKAAYDDIFGLMQSLLVAAGVVPNNNPDNVLNPQYLTSIFNLRYYAPVDYEVGTKVVGSDTETYTCIGANGPATTEQDPVTESAPRTKWLSDDARAFDKAHPVGTYYSSNVDSSPADFMGVGTWARMLGRFIVGLSEGDPDFDTAGEVGGSKTHTHPVPPDGWGSAQTGGALPSPTVDGRIITGSGGVEVLVLESLAQAANGIDTGATSGLPPYIVAYIWQRTA